MSQENSTLDPEETFNEIASSYSEFRRNVDEYFKSTAKCRSAIARYEELVETYHPPDDDARAEMEARSAHIQDMNNYLPKKNNVLLKLFLGDFNVVLPRQEDKQAYKRQYEMFKLWYIFGQLFFSSLNIVCGPCRIVEGLLEFYLVWFYCNLTMKETILIANGSRIRTWWLIQHYLDTVLYGFLLIRADGDFSLQFSIYILFMSGCQVLQFYYQDGSLYRLRALGRAHSMEVSAEGIRVKTFADLRFLTPFFVLLYVFQLYNGYVLWYIAPTARSDEIWEVYLCSLLFIAISMGNLFTLFHVLVLKYKIHSLSPVSLRRNFSETFLGKDATKND